MDEIHKDTFWIRCLSHRSERSSSLPCVGTRSAEVKVAEDKVHGSLATIRVKPAAGVSKKQIEDKVEEILARYTIRYKLETA